MEIPIEEATEPGVTTGKCIALGQSILASARERSLEPGQGGSFSTVCIYMMDSSVAIVKRGRQR